MCPTNLGCSFLVQSPAGASSWMENAASFPGGGIRTLHVFFVTPVSSTTPRQPLEIFPKMHLTYSKTETTKKPSRICTPRPENGPLVPFLLPVYRLLGDPQPPSSDLPLRPSRFRQLRGSDLGSGFYSPGGGGASARDTIPILTMNQNAAREVRGRPHPYSVPIGWLSEPHLHDPCEIGPSED